MKKVLFWYGFALILTVFLAGIGTAQFNESGLIAYWSFDEISTGNFTDLRFALYNASVTSGVTVNTNALIVNSANFSRVAHELDVIDDGLADDWGYNVTGFTHSFWINNSEPVTTTAGRVVMQAASNTAGRQYEYFLLGNAVDNGVEIIVYNDTNATTLRTNFEYNNSVFNHYAVVFNTSDVLMYINGELVNQTGFVGNLSQASGFAVEFGDNTDAMIGQLDEFGFWNRSLSAAEVSSLYNDGQGRIFPNLRIESVDYPVFVYETDVVSFNLNYSIAEDVILLSPTLSYNGTVYLGDNVCDGFDCVATADVNFPVNDVGTALQARNFFWSITSSDGTTTTTTNTDVFEHNVSRTTLEECGPTTETLNYTIRKESDQLKLVADFAATITYRLSLAGTFFRNVSFDLSGANEYQFCITESNQTFYSDIDVLLENDGYHDKTYRYNDEALSNVTTSRDLFMLNTTEGRDITLILKDAGLIPLSDYTIRIFRTIEGTGNEIQVVNDITDLFGQIVAKLIENTVSYKFEFLDGNNTLVKTVDRVFVACRSVICTAQFIIEDDTDFFDEFNELADYESTLSFDNGTNTYSFVWNDQRDGDSTHRLEVVRFLFNGTTTVCNETSTDDLGVMSCAVGGSRASYTATVYRTSGDDTRRISVLSEKVGDLSDEFGFEGMMWAFLLLFTLVLVGTFYPPVGIVLYLAGVIILGALDVVFISPAIIVAQLVIGVLFIWAFRN